MPKPRKTRRAVTLARLLGLGLLLLGLQLSCESGSPPEDDAERRPAPVFKGRTLEGDKFSLSDLRGKVVLVNFWATWCGPCRLEIPELAKLYQTYRDRDFVVVGVSLDTQPESYVRSEAKRMGVNYPVVVAGEITGAEWGGIVAIPTSFLIDRQGRIERRLEGYTPIDRMAGLVRNLLEEGV